MVPFFSILRSVHLNSGICNLIWLAEPIKSITLLYLYSIFNIPTQRNALVHFTLAISTLSEKNTENLLIKTRNMDTD